MSKKDFFSLTLWDRYSKKMQGRLETLRAAGFFTTEIANDSDLHLASGFKEYEEQKLSFYFLVDKTEGIISDAKFQAYGDAALLALADITTTYVIGKTYAQVERTSKGLLIKQFAEEKESFTLPEELEDHLQLILDALKEACFQCHNIPLEVHSPLVRSPEGKEPSQYPDFLTLNKKEQLSIVEEVLNSEVRPYVALDEGGVEVLDLVNGHELMIAYKGSCTSCYSSIGSTLSAIQGILQEKIHSSLKVVPNMDNLELS